MNLEKLLSDTLLGEKYKICTTDVIFKIIKKNYSDDYEDVKKYVDTLEIIKTKKIDYKIPEALKFSPSSSSVLKALEENNPNHYLIVTERDDFRKYIRDNHVNTPVLRLKKNMISVDHYTDKAERIAKRIKQEKINLFSKKRKLDENDKESSKKKKQDSSGSEESESEDSQGSSENEQIEKPTKSLASKEDSSDESDE